MSRVVRKWAFGSMLTAKLQASLCNLARSFAACIELYQGLLLVKANSKASGETTPIMTSVDTDEIEYSLDLRIQSKHEEAFLANVDVRTAGYGNYSRININGFEDIEQMEEYKVIARLDTVL